MLKHDGAQMQAVSQLITWPYREYAMRHTNMSFRELPPIHFHLIGKSITYHIHGEVDYSNFNPIDATPQFINREVRKLEDLVHFAPALVRTKEIILPEESVPELMERILKLQQPGREAELKRQLQADREGQIAGTHPRQKFHAQILSIAA
ncbi:hypothetical protein [Hyphomicrobium sp. ghe19]|uniref:hypothetical protein n=1 Tax=Hyphomicrobium sp. ghe19 TaxID=2682968 RepID=UPI0030CD69F8